MPDSGRPGPGGEGTRAIYPSTRSIPRKAPGSLRRATFKGDIDIGRGVHSYMHMGRLPLGRLLIPFMKVLDKSSMRPEERPLGWLYITGLLLRNFVQVTILGIYSNEYDFGILVT